MAGTNNCGALMEDWAVPSPSPRTLMSSFWSEEFSSGPFSHIISDNSSSKPQDGINKNKISFDSSEEDAMQETKASLQLESNLFDSNEKLTSHGGLAERMAVRAGFGVLKIDTSRVSSSAPVRSPVTIPPGVSPRELLESPVFLPKDIAQPSPTTGKLPFLIPHDCKSTILSVHNKDEDCLHDNTAFSFQPILRSKPPNFSAAEKGASVVCQNQSSANDNQESSLQSKPIETKYVTDTALAQPTACDSMLDNDQPSLADEQEESEENQNGEYSSTLITTPAEDGYNWRKYGQKQVKNSEHPRSYYKCTHPDCPVKKKVERSQDDHITEIVYKGSHSHPLPPPNRRPSVPLSQFNDLQADGQENFGSEPGHIVAASRGSTPNGCVHEVHSGVLETKLSGSLITTEIADTSVTESREAMDVSSIISSSDKDDKATLSSIPLTFDGDDDETESKRRKMDASATTNTMTSTLDMATMASRAVREPRIIVQTTSEVDILDDGYRWRKYGQKVVKGNPNPRSYYKCTHAGCGVRKHVERASNDLKSVITTYEGKHNHEVPAARNSSRHPSSSAAQQASNLQQRLQTEQDSIAQFSNVASNGSFCLPQLSAASGGFCFGMLPPGMAVPAVPVHIPGHPPAMHHYPGLILSRGGSGMKVNPAVTRSGSETNQQLMGRLPQGPHISIA